MNVSQLARQLRVHPKKLLEILPEFGFDIGARAVKVDDTVAQKIIKSWRRIKRVLEEREESEKEKEKEMKKQERQSTGATVVIPARVTVKKLAEILETQTTKLIMELMKNGILATQNEDIDHDTAVLIAEEFGFDTEEEIEKKQEEVSEHTQNLEEILSSGDQVKRPPVIVVVGHVDHGKTKLLDAIRNADVAGHEAGGITQHIGAYQVNWKNLKTKEKSPITFIDTPGHEAFTVMRSRGAKVADIAILVVAADDSVKPQTIESINIIKAAKISIVVAINKIDKEGADVKKVKVDLKQHGVVCEEWGGDVPMIEISAKQNTNIDKLLDILLLVAEMKGDDIKANPDRQAAGTIIEAHVDKGEGPVASVLVQTGTLKINNPLVVNGEIYGKVRAMKNHKGRNLQEAGPSCPVRVLGFKVAPQVGDVLNVGSADKAEKIDVKAKRSKQSGAERAVVVADDDSDDEDKVHILNVVIKADTLGSLEAVISSLAKIDHSEVAVRVVGKGLGNVTADDVSKAEAASALVCAFNVSAPFNIQEMIKEKNLKFVEYKIIYDLIDYVKDELEKLLNPEKFVTEVGSFKMTDIFRTDKNKMIVGGRVASGKLEKNCKVRVKRKGEQIGHGNISQLQSGKQEVNEVPEGNECGLSFEGKEKLEIGDVLECYKEETKVKKLGL